MKNKDIIPKGPYCYDENGICYYWCKLEGFPEQENGYCEYLEYGDYQINKEKNLRVVYTRRVDEDIFAGSKKKFSGEELGIPVGLLWDQCKECGINDDL